MSLLSVTTHNTDEFTRNAWMRVDRNWSMGTMYKQSNAMPLL